MEGGEAKPVAMGLKFGMEPFITAASQVQIQYYGPIFAFLKKIINNVLNWLLSLESKVKSFVHQFWKFCPFLVCTG